MTYNTFDITLLTCTFQTILCWVGTYPYSVFMTPINLLQEIILNGNEFLVKVILLSCFKIFIR